MLRILLGELEADTRERAIERLKHQSEKLRAWSQGRRSRRAASGRSAGWRRAKASARLLGLVMTSARTHLAERVRDFLGGTRSEESLDLHYAAHALEDFPADAREEARVVLSTPTGIAFQRRAFDRLEDTTLATFGELEVVLPFLARYPVRDYTYEVSGAVSRGDRPNPSKLVRLVTQGFGAMISLCEETPEGDAPMIARAGLAGKLDPYHVGIVDMTPPSMQQAIELMDLMTALADQGVRAYLHCEAGMGRTGVVVACYRMAVMGWGVKDALHEATNFGCWLGDQEAFIQAFAEKLEGNYDARLAAQGGESLGRYPRLPLGSVRASVHESGMTVATAAVSQR